MSPFEKGMLEGFGWVIGLVCVIAAGLTLGSGVIGGTVLVWRWLATVIQGGC